MLSIRPATPDDNVRIDELFAQARAFMAQNGNPTQWTNGFPNAAMLQDGMREGLVFVCCDDAPQADAGSGEVVGVYALSFSEPAYDNLKGGQWQKDAPYVVVHRMATVSGKGVGTFIIKELQKQYDYIRIDTHEQHVPMCQLLKKLGFVYCGTVFYSRLGGGERVAFDYVQPVS